MKVIKDFNPRALTGRDVSSAKLKAYIDISIHAPSRGATVLIIFLSRKYDISIHAPSRGATIRTILMAWNT